MKKNLIRSLKYILQLVVLFGVLFTLMKLSGTANDESFAEVFSSTRGILLLAAIILLAVFYPRFGFATRVVKADIAADREKIFQVMHMGGYSLESEQDGVMIFRAGGLRRAMMLWEDGITVASDDNYITISGIRKQVVKAEFRLKSML